jgi:hypothetical protein
MLLVSFLLGLAITFNRGAYADGAVPLVLVALGVLVYCCIGSARRGTVGGERNPRILLVLVWLGLVAMTFQSLTDEIIIYAVQPWDLGRKAQVLALLLLFTYLPFLTGRWREPKLVRLFRFGAFALTIAAAGQGVIRASPHPRIDVWTVQQAGAAALRAKKNPYVAVAERDTGPRVGDDVPYVYPPTQLYLTLPAYVAAGDVRYTMLAALVLAGIGMRTITGHGRTGLPSIAEDAPALYLWLMTKVFFIIEQSWVDPVQLMLITFTIVAYVKRWRWLAAVLLGVVLSAKQTMFWAVGLTGVVLRFNRLQWMTTVLTGMALVFPFVWLDFRALKHANFDFLSQLPTRPDALTFNSWYLRQFGSELHKNWGFVLAALAAAFAMWRMRGSAARLGVAIATTYAFFFTFNKWAFANYYFLMSGLAALGAAAACHGFGIRMPLSEYEARPPPARPPVLRDEVAASEHSLESGSR